MLQVLIRAVVPCVLTGISQRRLHVLVFAVTTEGL